jgi:hypothetical protein
MKLSELAQAFFQAGGAVLAANSDPEVTFFLDGDKVKLDSMECTIAYPDITTCSRWATKHRVMGDPSTTVALNLETLDVQNNGTEES